MGIVVCPGVYIPAAAERVNIVLGFVYRLYTRRRASGGLNVDPPTVGHVYSLLADGMKAFESGRSLCVSSSDFFPTFHGLGFELQSARHGA
jgi:hypothetical protein